MNLMSRLFRRPQPPRAENPVVVEVLRNDLNTALSMLADWSVAVQLNNTAQQRDCYLQAARRDGPLRAQLDRAIIEAWRRRCPGPECQGCPGCDRF